MRTSLVLVSLSVLAALAGRGEAAPTYGAALNSGDKVTGVIDAASDRDLFNVSVPNGAHMEILVKAAKKSTFLPDLKVIDPSGANLDVSLYLVGQSTPTVSIPHFGVAETGNWTVAVQSYQGTTGPYQLVIKVVFDTKIKTQLLVPAGGTLRYAFTGVDGALVDYVLTERGGPGLASAGMSDPEEVAIPAAVGVRAKTKVFAKKVLLGGGNGLYGVEMIGNGGGATTVDLAMVVRAPKVKPVKIALGEEPRPTVVAPGGGRDGIPFVVTGTGFADGARIVFGDGVDADATAVEWISSTELHGLVPDCAASRLGASVQVSVLNPDGQFGTSAGNFAFIGVPAAATYSPKNSPLPGGVLVTVTGARFRTGYSVDVGGVPAVSPAFLTATSMSFVTPAMAAGEYDVVVRDEFGRASPALTGLWYSAAPTVANTTPNTMTSLGGIPVTLTGTGLVPGTRVFVAGTEATVQALTAPTSLTFLCPPASLGTVSVEVRDPLNRSFTGNLLTMTRALHDVSAVALPAAPDGADFWGEIVNLGDTDGNGRPEILVTSKSRWNNPGTGAAMPASFLLRNLGTGTFDDLTGNLGSFGLPQDDGQGDAAVMGDLDTDGRAEVVLVRNTTLPTGTLTVQYGNYLAYYDINFPTTVDVPTTNSTRILKNNGAGIFTDQTNLLSALKASTPAFGKGERWQGAAAVLGDLDGDTDRDLVIASNGQVNIGTIASVRWTYIYVAGYYYTYKYKDKGIITQNVAATGALRVLKNIGSSTFRNTKSDSPANVTTAGGTILDDFRGEALAMGDLNGDGKADVVLVGPQTLTNDGAGGVKDAPGLRVLLNKGTGAFQFSPTSIPAPLAATDPITEEFWQGTSVIVGDFDGDGDRDIAVGRKTISTYTNGAGQVRIRPALRLFRNNGAAVFTEDTAGFLSTNFTTVPSTQTLLGVSGMAVVDIDADGDQDLVVTGKVTTPGSASIPGTARMATRILFNDKVLGLRDGTADWLLPYDFQPADSVAAGDLDGDGDQDLVLSLFGSAGLGKRSLRVLKNK